MRERGVVMKPKIYKTRFDHNHYPVIVSETGNYVCDARKSFNNPDIVFDFCLREMRMDLLPDEYLYVFVLDNRNRMTGFFEASHGSCNCSVVPTREVLRNLLLLDAFSFIMVHNHPSEDTEPSQEDIAATERLRTASEAVGVNMLDHIIFGNGYYSFKENALL